MRSYETARGLFSFLEFCSWALVLGGLAVVIYGFGQIDSFYPTMGLSIVLIGALMAFFGIVGAAGTQALRASVDSAEYAQQSLQIARDQLEISQRALRVASGTPETVSYDDLRSKSFEMPTASSGATYGASDTEDQATLHAPEAIAAPEFGGSTEYLGYEVKSLPAGFDVNGMIFHTFSKAKEYIEIQSPEVSTAEDAEFSHARPAPESIQALLSIGGNGEQTESIDLEQAQPIDAKPERVAEIAEYKGQQITPARIGFVVNKKTFDTVEMAKEYIDEIAPELASEEESVKPVERRE